MEQKEILEGNKLIAEFMGVTPDEKGWFDGWALFKAGLPFACGAHGNGLHNPPFHSDWNWLMAVVEKILDTCSETDDMESYYTVVDAIPNITSTHRTVVEFINYYNSNK